MNSRPFGYLLSLLLLLFHINNVDAEESLTLIEQHPAAPEFNLPDMDGNKFSLSDFRGKTVIINFWATWCPPCREELPSMNRTWHRIKNKNIDMIAINVGEDEDTIFSFMADYPIDFQVLLDQSGEVINRWPVKGLPTTFIVDPEGNLFYQAIGGREWDSDSLLSLIIDIQNK